MSNGNDALMSSGGTPWAKWAEKGDVVTGTVDSEPTLRQSRDYDTGLPATFPSGDPKMEIVVILQTAERSDEYEDDDGKRQVVMKKGKNLALAVRQAVKVAGASGLEIGGTLTITHEGEEQKVNSKGKKYDERLFSAKYVAPTAKAKATAQAKAAGVTEDEALAALAGLVG